MKILKVFGIVVGIHVFALVLIFANPGCSSSSKPPAATDTVAKAEPPPPAPITVPNTAAPAYPPISFNPDAPASAAPSGGSRYSPTRPNTAAAGALVAEPVKDVTPMTTHTVKSGDSLWTIANKNKLTPAELAAANNLKTSAVLKPGQKLIIPGKTPHSAPATAEPAAPAAGSTKPAANVATKAAPAPASGQMRHTVKSGETLGTIAQLYGVKQRDLAIANNITDPLKLAAGKDLVIPGWDPRNPAPSKSATKGSNAKPAADPATFAPPANDQVAPVISAQPTTPTVEAPVLRVEEIKKP